jgi:hypothetical protein
MQEKKYDLLFTGNMNYPPNIDSVLYLVQQVLPIVRATPGHHPADLRRGPQPAACATWPKNDPFDHRVRLGEGHPQLLRLRARIFVAPMQIGTGLQNKLLEAMAMRMPCASPAHWPTTPWAPSRDESILIGRSRRTMPRTSCACWR